MKMTLSYTLPLYPTIVEGIRRAPDRGYALTSAQTTTALKNTLRYIPSELHEQKAPEFMNELSIRDRIYRYYFRPAEASKTKPMNEYRSKYIKNQAFQMMINNNLSFYIAEYLYMKKVPFIKSYIVMYKEIHNTVAFLKE